MFNIIFAATTAVLNATKNKKSELHMFYAANMFSGDTTYF
jgi:hypothetical protein